MVPCELLVLFLYLSTHKRNKSLLDRSFKTIHLAEGSAVMFYDVCARAHIRHSIYLLFYFSWFHVTWKKTQKTLSQCCVLSGKAIGGNSLSPPSLLYVDVNRPYVKTYSKMCGCTYDLYICMWGKQHTYPGTWAHHSLPRPLSNLGGSLLPELMIGLDLSFSTTNSSLRRENDALLNACPVSNSSGVLQPFSVLGSRWSLTVWLHRSL